MLQVEVKQTVLRTTGPPTMRIHGCIVSGLLLLPLLY
jgi:hypothetical protein